MTHTTINGRIWTLYPTEARRPGLLRRLARLGLTREVYSGRTADDGPRMHGTIARSPSGELRIVLAAAG